MLLRIAIICLFIQFLCVATVEAGIYCYVDQYGVLHFSNVPTDCRYKPYKTYSRPRVLIRKRRSTRVVDESYYDGHIKKASLKYGVDFALLKAVIKAESNFDPYAVSPKGAEGLMQLMPQTSRLMKVRNPFNPIENIFAGTRYLRMLIKQFNNNLIFALAAYNAGPDTVMYYGGIPPFPETQNYVKRVLKYFRNYKFQLSMR